MQVIIVRRQCKHLIFADLLTSAQDLASTIEELKGIPCPRCGERVDEIDVVVDKDDFDRVRSAESSWNKDPTPRITNQFFSGFRESDIGRAEAHLQSRGGRRAEILDRVKANVLGRFSGPAKPYLQMIPVGLLNTYDPNALCAQFPDCSIPVVIVHRGLAQFVFYVNRIVVRFLEANSLGESARGSGPLTNADKDLGEAARNLLSITLAFLGAPIELPNVG